jgi:hypothetical protein
MNKVLALSPLLLLLLAAAGCPRRIAEFEIPNGYVGWVTVHYEAADCPAPANRSFWGSIIQVQPDGTACTQIWSGKGLASVTYYYVDRDGTRVRQIKSTGWGKGGEIWALSSTSGENVEHFFVGTEKLFNETKTGPP